MSDVSSSSPPNPLEAAIIALTAKVDALANQITSIATKQQSSPTYTPPSPNPYTSANSSSPYGSQQPPNHHYYHRSGYSSSSPLHTTSFPDFNRSYVVTDNNSYASLQTRSEAPNMVIKGLTDTVAFLSTAMLPPAIQPQSEPSLTATSFPASVSSTTSHPLSVARPSPPPSQVYVSPFSLGVDGSGQITPPQATEGKKKSTRPASNRPPSPPPTPPELDIFKRRNGLFTPNLVAIPPLEAPNANPAPPPPKPPDRGFTTIAPPPPESPDPSLQRLPVESQTIGEPIMPPPPPKPPDRKWDQPLPLGHHRPTKDPSPPLQWFFPPSASFLLEELNPQASGTSRSPNIQARESFLDASVCSMGFVTYLGLVIGWATLLKGKWTEGELQFSLWRRNQFRFIFSGSLRFTHLRMGNLFPLPIVQAFDLEDKINLKGLVMIGMGLFIAIADVSLIQVQGSSRPKRSITSPRVGQQVLEAEWHR